MIKVIATGIVITSMLVMGPMVTITRIRMAGAAACSAALSR